MVSCKSVNAFGCNRVMHRPTDSAMPMQANGKVLDYFDKYTFLCDFYDDEADMMRDLVLYFFPFDNSVQLVNFDNGKTMLKRVQLPPLKREMLQIGNIVNIFSKLLYIRDCAPLTTRTLFNKVESTFALIKPVPQKDLGRILTFIMQHGFRIVRMKNGMISKEFVTEMYTTLAGNYKLPLMIKYLTSAEVIGLELVAPEAVQKWRQCLGATNPAEAAPGTLRHLCGETIVKNVAHACTSDTAIKMLELYFGYENSLPRIPFRATMKNCTCCVIMAHAIIDGNAGAIIEQIITSGEFYIGGMAMFSVKLPNAREFYEVYKGVIPEYEAMCIHLAEGKCIVLEIKAVEPKTNVVCQFRKLCGPRDPELCRQLYPDSIRAQYGKNTIHNAVHCTDLPEDGELEVEYFFKLLCSGYKS